MIDNLLRALELCTEPYDIYSDRIVCNECPYNHFESSDCITQVLMDCYEYIVLAENMKKSP